MDPRAGLIAEIEDEARVTARWTGRAQFKPEVLDALRKVNRAAYIPCRDEDRAFINAPLSIGHGQTISQPFIVALMTDLLDLKRADRVMEVGTGSGYQAAVLAELCDDVCSIEVIPELADRAREVLAAQGYGRVALRAGDGGAGWPERAPFDAIVVAAAAVSIPDALVDQLAPGGRMVIPVGAAWGDQNLILVRKDEAGVVTKRGVLPVAFVPLTGGASRPA